MENYGIKYKCEFSSIKGLQYKVYILKKNYNSAVTDLRMGGTPVSINYTSNSENKFEIIRGSECVLDIFSEYDGQFSEIMTADKNEYMVQVWLNDSLHWQGYVIQDNYSEPFLAAPYLISLRATDGLGDLKLLDYAKENGTVFLQDMTFAESILSILGLLKNGTELVTSVDVFEAKIDRVSASNEALNNLTVNPFIFLKNELNPLKCDEVLKMILELFQCYIFYNGGRYYIERINQKLKESVTRRTYPINFDGEQSINNVVSTENIRGSIARDSELSFINSDHNISYVSSYNKVSVDSDTVDPKNLIVNNLFRFWDDLTNTPFNWVKSGNIDITKMDFPRSGSLMRMNSKAADSAISYSTNLIKPYRTSFTGLLTAEDSISILLASYGNVRLMVKATTSTGATWYMQSEEVTEDYTIKHISEFVNKPTFCKIERGTTQRNPPVGGTWYASTVECKLPADTKSIDFAFLPSFDTEFYKQGYQVREFTPTLKASDQARSLGDNYSIVTTKNHKETYDEFNPALGEFSSKGVMNQLMVVKESGKVESGAWYRDGLTESKSLFELAVRSIINQYRKPFRLFTGSFFGSMDIGKVYTIETLDGLFMPYKISTDLKMDLNTVDFFELLPEADDATDKYVRYINYKEGSYTTRTNATANQGNGRPIRGGSRS
jgi:hypothetical protein